MNSPPKASESEQGCEQLTLFQAGSPASHIVLPGSSLAKQMTARSGQKCLELSKNCGPLGFLEKMLLDSLEWASTARYLTWRPKATKQGRLYFQLAPSAPRMSESECLFWPTPDTQNHRDGRVMRKEAHGRHVMSLYHAVHLLSTPTATIADHGGPNQRDSSGRPGLQMAAMMCHAPTASDAKNATLPASQINRNSVVGAVMREVKLWPTPSASDCGRTEINPVMTKNGTIRHQGKNGSQSYARPDQVAAMFPTPTARCGKSPADTATRQGSPDLQTVIGGQLNPEWVEWLMGFPTGWTDLNA